MEQREQGYRPSALFNNSVHSAGIMNINQVVDDSQLVGVPVGAVTAEAGLTARVRVDVVEVGDRNGVLSTAKRRRGRPPRSHEKKAALPLSAQKKQAEEEDVCFICFDGGSLVLCDRRGCPKAYHPACIKRDESFFRSKAKWNCGWHICNSCQKASHYMCYTCPYSLCKGCTKDADYLCVRGNMGLCGTCMRTVMLIENIAVGNKETIEVDFDDMTSWEYLFKIYWVFLKSKLSLTLEELTKAKNPWKGDEIPKAKSFLKGTDMLGSKVEFSGEQFHGNDGKASCSDKFSRTAEAYRSKRKRTKSQPEILSKQNILAVEKSGIVKTTTLPEGTTWATKELLEFIAHMKNGDVSILSEFDVQDLVLDYVRTNNLRDPQQQSFIICDSRLITLFQKERVDYFEMLKLIEDHFLKKKKSPAEAIVGVAVTGTLSSQIEASVNNDCQLAMDNNKRQKAHWRQQINADPDEYAAIDVHNINLVYLKRCLLEHLLDDAENFHDKVVGSFVRVRVTGSDPKEDMYRLVLVVGTSKASESYILGTRRTNIMLEILNLDKKEVVLMDGISNQDFSEEECRRLCQSVKCGLIKRLTVGEIQKKAMMLRAIKVSGCLEAEILHINLLRDQASKMGHEKELRECLEKLERLKSPQECHRMLHEIPSVNTDLKLDTDEIPNVNTDPKLDADYDLDEDVWESNAKKQVEIVRPQKSEVCRKKGDLNSLLGACELLGCIGDTTIKDRAITSEQKSNMSTTYYVGGDGLTFVPREKVGTTQAHESVSESIQTQEVELTKLHGQNRRINPTGPGSMTNDVTAPVVVDDFETAKLWHYQDPTGTVQGPFSIIHLRKWNMSGHFPVDMRVWRTTEKQEDSILLTDVLAGKLCKEPPLPRNKCILPLEIRIAANDTSKKWENGLSLSQSSNATEADCKRVDDSSKMGQNDLNLHCNGSNKLQEIDFFDIFSPMPKDSYDSFKVGANEMKQSASSNLPVLGSGPSLEDNRVQIPELADEWVGCSMAAPKTSVEGWDCNLLPASSMRPTEGASDHVVIPTSGSGQLTHGSMSNHQAIDLGCQPNGLGGIVEESVSDLLAELEAFESGDGLASPTSKMRCGELTQASEDCFSPIEDFDPAPDPGKSDAFTSSVNKIVNP